MLINMETIYELLKDHDPELHLSQKDSAQINNVVLLRGDQDYKSNLLYVGKASDLLKLMPIESPLNVVCLRDVPLTFDVNDKLNLIIVNTSANIAKIYNDINTLIINRTNLHNSTTKLFNALLLDRGLQHIVNIATEVLDNPILVYNRAYKILSYSKNVIVKDTLWNELVTKGYSSYENYNLIKEGMKKAEMTDNPTILEEDKIPYRILVTKIKSGGIHIGYVSTAEHIRPFRENDLELMGLLSKLVATELQKDNLLSQTKGLLYEHLITELLDSEKVNQKYLEDRLNFIDLELKENLYVLTARQKTDDINPLPFYKDVLGSLLPGSKSVLYNNDLIFLISRKKNKPFTKLDAHKALKFLEENKMQAGLSRCFHDISLIRRYYIQSYKAIEIGSRLKQDDVLFMYDEYSLHHLLDIAAEQSDLRDFCSNSLFELIEYDKLNQTKFTQTLQVYLLCGSNVNKTAQIFNIHRNSIDYRIKKVEDILEIDLSDAETHFALYASFKIISFLNDDGFFGLISDSLATLD